MVHKFASEFVRRCAFTRGERILKRECHDNQWFFFSHFVWGKIMAATRKDRGNIWASRAPLNAWPRSDRGQAGRSNFFKLSLQLGGQVVVLSFADWWTHSIRRQTADLREHLASNAGIGPQKIFFVEWKAAFGGFFFFFFFFVRTTTVASLDGQQDVQCSKVRLLAERSWTDDMQGPWAPPSNVRDLRAGRPHNLPQVRFLSRQVFVTHCANATTKAVLARMSTSIPRTRSSFSAFAFTHRHTSSKSLERELCIRPHCRFLLPVTHALGDEIAEASFGRRAEPNTRIKNDIDIAVAANLEPWRRGYHLARAS